MRKLLNVLYVLSEDSYLKLSGENIVIQRNGADDVRIPLHNIERIVCFSYLGASPSLLGKCVENGIDISFFSPSGKFMARVNGIPNGNVLLRREQYRIADDNEKKLDYAKSFLLGKAFNSRWVLERMCRDHPEHDAIENIKNESRIIRKIMDDIQDADSIKKLMGFEGDCAKHYFSVFDNLILNHDACFSFSGRTRRPPLDAVNALLSFAYSMLANECAAALSSVGLDPYVGFLHSDRPGRVSLALDLEEELRSPVADRFVLTTINLRVFSEKMFDFRENGSVLLNEDGRKLFIQEWQKRKKELIRHPFLKEKIEWGLVPYAQALLLARTIRGDLNVYPPFLWK